MAENYGSLDWFNSEYARVCDDPWGLSWRPSQFIRYAKVLNVIDDIQTPISNAIDIGCSTGVFTFLLHRHMPKIQYLLGVDFVEEAVLRACKRYPELQFSCESIANLGTNYANKMDLAICMELLYYLDGNDQQQALISMREALRPDGHAIFTSLISGPPHFTPSQLAGLIGREFEIIRTEILCLRLISFAERALTKYGHLVLKSIRPGGTHFNNKSMNYFSIQIARALECLSRLFRNQTASHTIILAKAKR